MNPPFEQSSTANNTYSGGQYNKYHHDQVIIISVLHNVDSSARFLSSHLARLDVVYANPCIVFGITEVCWQQTN
jgi:hypothetical protein